MILPIICICTVEEKNNNQLNNKQIISKQIGKKIENQTNSKFLISENYDRKTKNLNSYLKFKDNSNFINKISSGEIADKTLKETAKKENKTRKNQAIKEEVVIKEQPKPLKPKKDKKTKKKNIINKPVDVIKQQPNNTTQESKKIIPNVVKENNLVKNNQLENNEKKKNLDNSLKKIQKEICKYKLIKGDEAHDLVRDFILHIYNKEYPCSKFIGQNNISIKINSLNSNSLIKLNNNNIDKLIGFISNNLNTFICENYLNNNYPILNDNIFDFIKNSNILKKNISEIVNFVEVFLIEIKTNKAVKILLPVIKDDNNIKSPNHRITKIMSKISNTFNNDIKFFKNLILQNKKIIDVNKEYKLEIIKVIENQKRSDIVDEILLFDFMKNAVSKFIINIKIPELNLENQKTFIFNIKKTLNNLITMIFLFNVLAD